MKTVFRLAAALAILSYCVQFANAQTTYYYNDAGSATARNWEDTTKWTPSTAFPNAEGDVAIFNSLATANNVAQTANHIVSLNTTGIADKTVGRIDFNLDNNNLASRNEIRQGTGGTLIFDGAGATNSQINVVIAPPSSPNTGAMGLDTITAPMQLNDQLQITISNTSNRADGLALRLQGSISGSGGITRLGVPGSLLTMIPLSGNTYTYTGPTILDGGRTQVSALLGMPTASSSFTIQGTGQLEPADSGTYQLGAANAPLYLNSDGTGNTGGQGTIRPVRTATGPTQIKITNSSVVLQAPVTVVHSEGQGANGVDPSLGYIEFDGVVSGGPTNKLQFTTTSHSQNHGTYVLTNANTFSGGIDLWAGRLSTDFLTDAGNFNPSTVTANPNATFGAGDIHVLATQSNVALSVSRLTIPSGVLNAIGNSATLSIDGNADWGRSAFAELGDGVDEVVGKLVLGGVTQLSGVTYGSTANTGGAIFTNDTYFTGTGIVQVGPLGDFSGNGVVDAADYVVWRKSFSSNTALYDLWRSNFGNTAPGSGSVAGGLGSSNVPEPSTLVLVALVIAPLWANRRRRFASRQE